MITTLKRSVVATTQTLSSGDINSTLTTVTRYAWFSAAGLFACYLYFIGAITFSVIKQEGLSQHIKSVLSQTSKEELAYLGTQRSLTEEYAKAQGFVAASTQSISYTVPASAFAWNFNVRE